MELSPPDPRVGQILQGRYRIMERVAAGAMGVVYRGERVTLARPVAVKFLHPWVAAQQAFRTRFETEARAMSRLSHPNCVSVIDFGLEGSPYVVMDFIAGSTLRQLLEAGRLAPARAVGIARQLLAGVAHAHAQGIVHRDLKPENLILGDTAGLADHVRILDFGLAKLRDGPAMTAGMAIGTPGYMSPEQTGAPGEIDGRTDIYAVGILLFEMLAGRKPFVSEKIAEILLMHRDTPPPSLRQLVPEAESRRAGGRGQSCVGQESRIPIRNGDGVRASVGPGSRGGGRARQRGFPVAHRERFRVDRGGRERPGGRSGKDHRGCGAEPPRGDSGRGPTPATPEKPSSTDRGVHVGRRQALGGPAGIGRAGLGSGVGRCAAPSVAGPVRPGVGFPGMPAAGRAVIGRGGGACVEVPGRGHYGVPVRASVKRAADAESVPWPAVAGRPGPVPPPSGPAPPSVDERMADADRLTGTGEWEQAIVVLEKAHHEHPDSAVASYRLANLLL